MHFEVNRKLLSRSDRVKSVDFHPTEPWILCGLYNGHVTILSTTTSQVVKSFELTTVPIRTVRFIARKNWFVAGSDDFQLRVYNYHTHEKITSFEAHPDYIRFLCVHPSLPIVLTASDDMTIKAWDWDKSWRNIQTYEGHTHYIMNITFSPKDAQTFASACLDRTIKIWSLGTATANMTMEPHDKGVNYVDFFPGPDRPYLVTCSDDKTVKVWDYLSKSCVATMEGHTNNVSFAVFHPTLPIIISGSEDGTVKIWNANTFRIETTLSYALERSWCVSLNKGTGEVGLGFDEGVVVVRVGKEEPTFSMDASGKLVWAKAQTVYASNLSVGISSAEDADGEEGVVGLELDLDKRGKDGLKVEITPKELGSSELYATSLLHSPNGRFITAQGDGEYIIYTALAWRNKSFGNAISFAWSPDSNVFAVLESKAKIKLFKNFKEKPGKGVDIPNGVTVEALYTGPVLGARGNGFVMFWDWDTGSIVRRIDVDATGLFWSNTDLVLVTTSDSFYILRYDADAYAERKEELGGHVGDEGVEEAFDVVAEGPAGEVVKTAKWINECLVYTTSSNRLNYLLLSPSSNGTEDSTTSTYFTQTISPLDTPLYLLNYLPTQNAIYLADKEMNIFSFTLSEDVIEYQTAVLNNTPEDERSEILSSVPKSMHNRVARFLESRGLFDEALKLTSDAEHKFELAIQLSDLELATEVVRSLPSTDETQAEAKWKVIGDAALKAWDFTLAKEAFGKAGEDGLDGLFLLVLATGDREGLSTVVETARKGGRSNLAFVSALQLAGTDGKAKDTVVDILGESGRWEEAALWSRSHAPALIPKTVEKWQDGLIKAGKKKIADGVLAPSQRPDLFPELDGDLVDVTS